MIGSGNFQLHVDDAISFLQGCEPATADLIVSSPPYFMGKEYDTSLKPADFTHIHRKLAPLISRALKPGGSVCWQVGFHQKDGVAIPLDYLTYAAFAEASELQLRNRIIWTIGHGTHAAKRFSGRYESVLWYTKGRTYYFDLDSARVPQKYPGKRHYKGPKKGEWSGNPLGKNPGDVWEIPNVKANHVEKTDHPCQFPVALVQRIIRSLTPVSGLVLDPFAGAASAGVAALIEGRSFCGCDINPLYVAIGRERLAACARGELPFRSIDEPIFTPTSGLSVAKAPAHFGQTIRSHGYQE